MKTRVLFLMLITALLLTACSSKPKSEFFDETKSVDLAKEVVQLTVDKDYKKLIELCNDQMKEVFTEDTLKKIEDDLLGPAGAFKEIAKTKFAEVKDKDKYFATVLVDAKFENSTKVFTISFDQDYKLAGYFIK